MPTPEALPLSPPALSGHPAIRAWQRLRPRPNDPEVVETLVHNGSPKLSDDEVEDVIFAVRRTLEYFAR